MKCFKMHKNLVILKLLGLCDKLKILIILTLLGPCDKLKILVI
jgi:hypothetical protein